MSISVIIPSRNRFDALQRCLQGILNQSYSVNEIIVIDDASTDIRYQTFDWSSLKVTHLRRTISCLEETGVKCPAVVRNNGIFLATSEFLAFCDDDDVWLPNKLSDQMSLMSEENAHMSFTEGLYGTQGKITDKDRLYNREQFWSILSFIYIGYSWTSSNFPTIITSDIIKRHNIVICSSVVIKTSVVKNLGGFKTRLGWEDYDLWLRAIAEPGFKCVYVKKPCVWYDATHGKLLT